MNPSQHTSQSDEAFEPWQLTAYALGELDPETTERVRAVVSSNPGIQAELRDIQQTIGIVRTSIAQTSSQLALRTEQEQELVKQISAPERSSLQATLRPDSLWYKRRWVYAALATAAAIPLIAGPFWIPKGQLAGGKISNQSGMNDSATDELRVLALEKQKANVELGAELKGSLSTHASEGMVTDLSIFARDFDPAAQPKNQAIAGESKDTLSDLVGQNSVDASATASQDASRFPPSGPITGKPADATTAGLHANSDTYQVDAIKSLGNNMTTDLSSAASSPTAEMDIGFGYQATSGSGGMAGGEARRRGGSLGSAPKPAGTDFGVSEASPMPAGFAGGGLPAGYVGGAPSPQSAGSAPVPAHLNDSEAQLSQRSAGFTPSKREDSTRGLEQAAQLAVESKKDADVRYKRGESERNYSLAKEAKPAQGLDGTVPSIGMVAASDPIAAGGKALAGKDQYVIELGRKPAANSEARDGEGFNRKLPDELRANVPHMFQEAAPTGDRFEAIVETPFVQTSQQPLSTFSVDVDTASYTKLRQYLIENNSLPRPDAVRIEEMVNYFEYDYPGPKGNDPFAAHLRVGTCPWNTEHKLVRVALQAKKVDTESRPAANIVFLIDVSGSMSAANKLPLVKKTLSLMTSQLKNEDRVAIVVYAGAAGCVLPSTPGSRKDAILSSIEHLQSGGSTNGGQGIQLAYDIARENFVAGGINRVVLCTDGDFNVGVTGTDELVSMMKENAKSNVFLTCLGYGIGNYNDSMMEQISDKGNGTYGMVDNELEARRMMVEQLSGTLMTVAKDVKIQVEFNPQRVAAYRLVGYENRRLANQDFDNDKKDAGEIGAGHRVTAFYEVVPIGAAIEPASDPQLRYQVPKKSEQGEIKKQADSDAPYSKEWLVLKVRSKQPEAAESTKQEFILPVDQELVFGNDEREYAWATSVAEFGLLLRHSKMAPNADWYQMVQRAEESVGDDPYRRECLTMMRRAKALSGK